MVKNDDMPIEYLTGQCEFAGLTFLVDKRVFIPRKRSEHLVTAIVEMFSSINKPIKGLELCAGSGAIGCAVAYALKNVDILLADISADAVEVCRANIKRFHLGNCAACISDFFDGIGESKYDFIVANPPYSTPDEVLEFPSKVRDHEPAIALSISDDPLFSYKMILNGLNQYLKIGGLVFLESSIKLSSAIVSLYKDSYKVVRQLSENKNQFIILRRIV